MLEVPAPNCTTLTKGAASCEDVFRAVDELGFEPEDGIGVDAAHKEGVGLARGFTCADVPWARWNSACEFDILFVRKDVTDHWMDARHQRGPS